MPNLRLGKWGFTSHYKDSKSGIDHYASELNKEFGLSLVPKDVANKTLDKIADMVLEKMAN